MYDDYPVAETMRAVGFGLPWTPRRISRFRVRSRSQWVPDCG